MSKIITWIVIVGVVAVGGYFAFNPKDKDAAQEETATPEENTEEVEGKKMAFSEFLKTGGAYQCTVSQHVGDVTNEGTIYVDGVMIRGEFNSAVNGLNVDSNMIARDGFTYSWSSMTPNLGFKVKSTPPAETDAEVNTSASYSWNAETIGDYNCESWTADSAVFEIPANITFQEMGGE